MEKKFQKFVNQVPERFFGYPALSISQSLYDKSLRVETGVIASSAILNFVSPLAVKLGVHYYVALNDNLDGVVLNCYVG